MECRLFAAALLFLPAAFGADQNIERTIKDLYTSTLNAMKNAKTKDDVQTLVNGMDVPEWVGISPDGETQTRAETLVSLEQLLAIPPEKRPTPLWISCMSRRRVGTSWLSIGFIVKRNIRCWDRWCATRG